MVLKYKKEYIFNFSSPIFSKVMLTSVALSSCSFLVSEASLEQFHYFFLQYKAIVTELLLHSLALLPFKIIYIMFVFSSGCAYRVHPH